jgi:IS30 family transposase
MTKSMSIEPTQKNKHLNSEQRAEIESGLTAGQSFRTIAQRLGKDPGTIAKEVRKRRFRKQAVNPFHNHSNTCRFLPDCEYRHLCGKPHCMKLCRSCPGHDCNQLCRAYEERHCAKLNKAPGVCNACQTKNGCRLSKYWYRASQAVMAYRELLSVSRMGINLTPDELTSLDELVSPLISKGQSISHIYANHRDEIHCSRKTLYSYINQGCLSVINLDLPRQVKYKKRRKHRKEQAKNFKYRNGRQYQDFLRFIAQNADLPIIEIDTVEGSDCSEVLLTLLFRTSRLMLIDLLPSQSQACVLKVFDRLEHALGAEQFARTFPVILTDNGSEFKDPEALERSVFGGKRTRLFYCDPGAAWQKGALEKNHEFIRYVLPKGVSFDWLAQDLVFLLRDHINSTCRDTLNGNSPLDLARLLLSSTAFERLGLRRIQPDDIVLKPHLLKIKA